MAPALAPLIFLLLAVTSFDRKVQGSDDSPQVDFVTASLEEFKNGDVCSELKELPPNSLKVVRRYGPCVDPNSNRGRRRRPTVEDILRADRRRVAYLLQEHRVDGHPAADTPSADGMIRSDPLVAAQLDSLTIPALKGSLYESNDYVVTLQLGASSTPQTVIFDTGSHLCWVQCQPCRSCYPQRQPIFDPRSSSSYRNVSCTAMPCINLPKEDRGCTGRPNHTCVYRIQYFENSSTTGFLATDRLRIGRTNTTIEHFVFGCGHTNAGRFGKVAGLFGLGRGFHSLATQLQAPASTGGPLGGGFFYCLPTADNGMGYLGFGRREAPSARYTPMLNTGGLSSMYQVKLLGISVGGQRLQIPATVFRTAGAAVDSGTVITMLPPLAYAVLREAFRRGMSHYHMAPPFLHQLDTCYDDINPAQLLYPGVTLHFNGVDLQLKATQVFVHVDGTRFNCLAFQSGLSTITVIGNAQQRGMEVIFDVAQRRIGFSEGANCR